MDGERSGSSAVCGGGGGVGGDITELEGGGEESCWMSPHPLVLVGVLQPQVVGQRSHGDGQLADLLQLNGPLVSPHDERVHPPVGGLEEGREPGEMAKHSLCQHHVQLELVFNVHFYLFFALDSRLTNGCRKRTPKS